MAPRHKRLIFVGIALAMAGVGLTLLLSVFSQSLVFFYSPSELMTHPEAVGRKVRLGGIVTEGSIVRQEATPRLAFALSDGPVRVEVQTDEMAPAMFREGQGVVAEGLWDGKLFIAQRLLTKHDENYMPPEVAKALKEKGVWRGEEGTAPPLPNVPKP